MTPLLLLLACQDPKDDVRRGPADGESGAESGAPDGDSAESGGGESGGESGGAETGSPDPCLAIAPSGDPESDHAAITACLASGEAALQAGTFLLDQGLALPVGARLSGAGAEATTLRLTAAAEGSSALLSLAGSAEVAGLHLDGDGRLSAAYVNAAVVITGSGNLVRDCVLGNDSQSPAGVHDQGVYFVDAAGTGNVVRDVEIRGTFYGVIFVGGLAAGSGNRLETSTIHDTRCDSVTLVGYGEVVGNTIYETGWDCENGPIPGGGIYSLWNTDGGLVEGNTIHDTCGHGVDMDGVQGMVITGNTIYDPGYDWDGAEPVCEGAAGIALIDSSNNTITDNVVENSERPNNAGWDPNGVYAASGASAFSDLPYGSSTIVAFALTQRPSSPGQTVGNVVDGNELRSACTGGCGGVGYFLSRGTGTDASGGWSAETTNYLTANNPYGSNVGSVRCGGNWYAASSSCPGDADCNQDDDQHSYDWARNDDCRDY